MPMRGHKKTGVTPVSVGYSQFSDTRKIVPKKGYSGQSERGALFRKFSENHGSTRIGWILESSADRA